MFLSRKERKGRTEFFLLPFSARRTEFLIVFHFYPLCVLCVLCGLKWFCLTALIGTTKQDGKTPGLLFSRWRNFKLKTWGLVRTCRMNLDLVRVFGVFINKFPLTRKDASPQIALLLTDFFEQLHARRPAFFA